MFKYLYSFRTMQTSCVSTKLRQTLYELLSQQIRLAPSRLKDQSTIIMRAWTRQCEYIVAQRFRRTQQMFCLYTKMWEERALRELLSRMRQLVTRRSKEFVFGAMGVSAFNWQTEKISDEEIYKHFEEFDYVAKLKRQTVVCKKCNRRRLVDIMLPDMNYCKCSNSQVYTLDDWVPFLERKDLLVWRRLRSNGSNYEYKLYGTYDDVTAEDFLNVQVDTAYRQKWDTTAINLFVVDSDESSNSDVIYWEMLWPRMFSNRDYVYNRRYVVDEERNVITIVSKSIAHPSCPVKQDKHRVRDYESCMVIRPSSGLDKPGIEFSLTYYDDPGVNIPAAVASWVAIAGMPDFLAKLRQAAKVYREQNQPLPSDQNKPEDNKPLMPMGGIPPPCTQIPNSDESTHQTSATPTSETESASFWRYIHPYYYLG